ncbi:MAG: hypothetical protein E5299_00910 [Burkholderia gladioli]|nr:MAG: hypothetical protein E5299_00910 [Burkholderia gladioli]
MRKDIHKKGEPKARYRVRNWAAYNAGLIPRGDRDDMDRCSRPCQNTRRPYPDVVARVYTGRYADSGITWREDRLSTDVARPARFHPKSLRDLAFPSLPVPNYTTLCCWAKRLISNCRSFATTKQIHLVVDSTGLKVYGEGEWKGLPARLLEAEHVASSLSRAQREYGSSACRANDATTPCRELGPWCPA